MTSARIGSGYGVMAGSRVTTEKGLVAIEELPGPGALLEAGGACGSVKAVPLKLSVASRPLPSPAEYWIDSGRSLTVRVSTRHGFALHCGHKQPVLTLGIDLRLQWKAASALQAGDLLCMPQDTRITPAGTGGIVEGFSPSLETTELAGVLCGDLEHLDDGCAVHVNQSAIAMRIGALASSTFDREFSFKMEGIFDQFRVEMRSGGVREFLHALKRAGAVHGGASLPGRLFRGAPGEIARFLHGLCSSTSGGYPRAGVWYIEFLVSARETAEALKLLLLQALGVVSGRIYPAVGGGYLLRAGGRTNMRRFFNHMHPAYDEPLLMLTARKDEMSSSRPPRLSGWSLAKDEAEHGDYLFEPVSLISEGGDSPVYSLDVPQGGAFVANGFIVKAA